MLPGLVCRSIVFVRLFLLFVLVPLADLILILMLVRVSWQLTVLLVLISGLLGAWYVRKQGTAVVQQIRQTLEQNKVPTDVLVEGGLVLLAGGLLITPGIITDLLGFSMLITPCRRWYRHRFVSWLKRRVRVKTFSSAEFSKPGDPNVIDAEVVGRRDTDETGSDDKPRSDPPGDLGKESPIPSRS